MYAVFMSDNPASLYKAVNSIVLINKPCYCLTWIYNPPHCSFSNSFIAVCVVGAEKSPYAAILSEHAMNAEITSFVKASNLLYHLVWIVKPFVYLCCIAMYQLMCSHTEFILLCRGWK